MVPGWIPGGRKHNAFQFQTQDLAAAPSTFPTGTGEVAGQKKLHI